MVDKIAKQIEVQKVNVKTKTVNQDVVKEIGFMSYPGRSYGRGSLVNWYYVKILDYINVRNLTN